MVGGDSLPSVGQLNPRHKHWGLFTLCDIVRQSASCWQHHIRCVSLYCALVVVTQYFSVAVVLYWVFMCVGCGPFFWVYMCVRMCTLPQQLFPHTPAWGRLGRGVTCHQWGWTVLLPPHVSQAGKTESPMNPVRSVKQFNERKLTNHCILNSISMYKYQINFNLERYLCFAVYIPVFISWVNIIHQFINCHAQVTLCQGPLLARC